ncbi:putative acid phosphatase [Colletotrichum karsti]|uniref:Acid phosphatase n=1 Tax=Colletotrichum karsti TaxID=1095194 RepID=A0A9P6HT39_9PEZI|nr:putative acid phosphatase [Colletotrichum karsti]KAF9869659.1 putative acid phosphatase [Colletotrichum karsti]
MLPEPTLSFTLPSLHDDTVLDCRVYHCQALHPAAPNSPTWKRHAAVIAHPYAPLGGCYDDPIVDIVAGTLLRQGFLVGTFNFRGASGSAGRTSWTAKPERSDYMSFVGFMVYYMHYLDPFGPGALRSPSAARTPSPPDMRSGPSSPEHPLLLLGGYSYGAMVTTQIPPIKYILAQFKSPAVGSAAADIRLRAQHLAEQQNVILASARAAQSTSPRKKYLGMRVGGDEDSQRKSHDSKRSFSLDAEDKIRRGVNDLLAKTKRHHHHLHRHKDDVLPEEKEEDTPAPDAPAALEEVVGLTQMRTAYLLVSPLQGVITHLATMSFLPTSVGRGLFARAPSKSREQGAPTYTSDHRQLSESKLVENPTLALFGDKDVFVPVAKLRSWVERLEHVDGSHFRGEEVASAGHFWAEGKVAHVLRDKVAEFAGGLVQPAGENVKTGDL